MSKIDEIIQVANENDRYGEPLVFEEADADGRWMLYVAERHERRQAIATPRSSSSSPDPVVHLPGPLIRNKSSTNVNTLASRDNPHGNSDVADRNKENNQTPRSFFETNGSGAFDSDSSDDEDMGAAAAAAADDAEQERIMQLFEDFPTCIQKARHLPATDSEEHGIMIISNTGSGWSHIDPARLPPRVQKYLADFTALDAATFPDSVYPDLAPNGASPRRWLLATARKEFVCDTSTLDVWYRPLAHTHQTKAPQQPV